MITLDRNRLEFSFPEVHEHAKCHVSFIRTLRIPDDNRKYPLPPGFSRFPLRHVDDYADRLPEAWAKHGGVFLPIHQSEAMWLSFSGGFVGRGRYPFALKIAAGKINAITGEPWTEELQQHPKQDYVVIPGQPWLDGFFAGEGLIRQFVAMAMGDGYTAEEQLTGKAEFGGLQIVAYPLKASLYKPPPPARMAYRAEMAYPAGWARPHASREMGMAPGGLMRQRIHKDRRGVEAWDQSVKARCFVHLLSAAQYLQATGSPPPTKPPTAQDYSKAGLPWFDYYDPASEAVGGTSKLAELTSVGAATWQKTGDGLPGNDPVTTPNVVTVGAGRPVRDGDWSGTHPNDSNP